MKRFDPDNSFDAAAEKLRKRIVQAIIAERENGNLSSLPPTNEIEALIAGGLTALVGSLFCAVRKESRDDVMRALSNYLPHARVNAEGILEERP